MSHKVVIIEMTDVLCNIITVARHTDMFGGDVYEIKMEDQLIVSNASADSAMLTFGRLLMGIHPLQIPEGSCYDPCEVRDINGKTIS